MAEFIRPKHGEICWQELTTNNLNKAKAFYQQLLGWNLVPSKLSPKMEYSEIHVDETAIGGMLEITKDWGENWEKIPSHWMTYIAVDNVDETIEKIKANGGGVCVPPFDAPGVGRMAVVNNPAKVTFSIISFQ